MADLALGVPRTPATDEVAAVTFLSGLPKLRDLNCDVDAAVVFPGMAEWQRVTMGCAIHNAGLTKYLGIAHGVDDRENYVNLSIKALKMPPYNLVRTEGVIVGDDSFHTGHQAEFTLRMVRDFGLKSLVHIASLYHEYRAFRTLLAAFIKSGTRWISMIPDYPVLPPSTIIPESKLSYWDSSPGETERVFQYQAKRDVASFEETRRYIDWFWADSPLRFCIKDDYAPNLRSSSHQ